MRYKRVLFLCLSYIFLVKSSAQNTEFKLENYTPPTPTAFQFLKYMEMPVSEFRGIPSISIPLHRIEEDGVVIPLDLTYHAGGIKVTQEASWVGLGWDLQIGSIVQEINDLDDYSTSFTRMLPDYNFSAIPTFFPMKYQLACPSTYNSTWTVPFPNNAAQEYHSYMISRANWVPLGGVNSEGNIPSDLFNSYSYDSEPDIFRANFLGYSLTFVVNFPSNSQFRVLDKKGYIVQKTTNGFKIIVPEGEEYYFESNNTAESYSTSSGGLLSASTSPTQTSSKTWMLTKIITVNKREILFNYTQTALFENFPAYAEKWYKVTNGSGYNVQPCTSVPPGYMGLQNGGTAKTFSFTSETRIYLSSITFPNGQINFTLSNRTDMLGAKKLDQVQIVLPALTKTYSLSYSYFDATAVGGNVIVPSTMPNFGNTQNFRLKLNSILASDGATHTFSYDATPLPPKNSFAQDLWGYYNGQLGHTSLVPNPTRLNIAGLADNGNNNSANINYLKAGMLTSIQYPTGGSVSFEYELNQFNNYWVADFSSTSNTITSGNGLRVKTISWYSDVNRLEKRTKYTYEGGKDVYPLTFYRQYPITGLQIGSGYVMGVTPKSVDELNGKGFFSSNSLGSGGGIGYSKVIREEVDGSGNANGKVETYFYCTPDIVPNPAANAEIGTSLPPIKSRTVPENGSIQYVKYYNSQNNLVKDIANTYTNINSSIYYGARMFGYASVFYGDNAYSYPQPWLTVPQTLIGYYPIYGKESLLNISDITDYDLNGNSTLTRTIYYNDAFNQVTETLEYGSNELVQTRFDHAYDNLSDPGYAALYGQNRLTEVTKVTKYKRDLDYNNARMVGNQVKEYVVAGNKVLLNKVTVDGPPIPYSNPDIITYDLHDTYGNPLQVTSSGLPTSMLWDHQGKYLVAEAMNSEAGDIAYSSFETSYTGNWAYSGAPSTGVLPPTGQKVYSLSGGNIVRSGLSSSKIYIVSYWKYNGSISVNGATAQTGRTIGSWTFYRHRVVNPASGTITISGSATIDELRLYQEGSQMNTYVVSPLLGILSKCDANNEIVYYEYDYAGRLSLIRNIERQIVQKLCYNYANQLEACPFSATPQWQSTGTLRCQPCTNPSYTTNVQEHQERDVNPNSPSYNTTRWVSDGIPGSCTNNCPVACSPLNCSGNDKKCIGGVCETGVAICISSVNNGGRLWTCTWKYCFSDGTLSTYSWTTSSSRDCPVLTCH